MSGDADRPLLGRRVLVTRAAEQAGELRDRLAALGALVVVLPVIRIVPPADEAPLAAALARLAEFDWVIFTSANAVEAVARRLAAGGEVARAFDRTRVCAVGPATAAALARRGVRVDRVPAEFIAEGILAAFAGEAVAGRRFLLPSADLARDTLAAGLAARGALVERVTAYRTVPATDVEPATLRLIRAGAIDAVTLASASAARNLAAALGGDLAGLERALVVAIGPATAAAAAEAGLPVAAVAAEHTLAGLVAALVTAVAGAPPAGERSS